MKVQIGPNRCEITLSRRNVETMAKAVALGVNPDLLRKQDDGVLITIHVESDEEHYKNASEERRAGRKEVHALLNSR